MPVYDVYLIDPKQTPFSAHPMTPVFRGIQGRNEDDVRRAWDDYRKTDGQFSDMTIKEIKKVG